MREGRENQYAVLYTRQKYMPISELIYDLLNLILRHCNVCLEYSISSRILAWETVCPREALLRTDTIKGKRKILLYIAYVLYESV